MRVLIVLAHKNNPRGKLLGQNFVKHVRAAFAACPCFQERLDLMVRPYSQLDEFLPPAVGEGDVPNIVQVRDRLTTLDGIDFVFLDGDENLLPWSRPAAPLLQLLHLSLTSGKIVFGCGCVVQLLAYLTNVGPAQVPVLNGGGKGGPLRGFGGSKGPGGSRPASAAGPSSDNGGGMLLERETGDLFRHDERRGAWVPVGNVGVHCSLGSGLGEAAISTGINRSDGIGPCELAQRARFHPLFEEVWPAKLIVPEQNEWHCHLPSFDAAMKLPTGHFEVQALATSRLGVQVVECRNAVALQFRVEEAFPQTVRMLHNFVRAKVMLSIGEGAGEHPSRILEMTARDPKYTDLVQQVLRSLAPPPSGAFGGTAASARPASAHPSSSAPARSASAAPSRPGSAASVPTLGQSRRAFGASASQAGLSASAGACSGGPGSARSEAPSAAAPAGVAPSGGSFQGVGQYQVAPKAALSYLRHSGDALKTHAENVNIGRTTKAFADMPGIAQDVPLYATRPPRASSAGATRTANKETSFAKEHARPRSAAPPSQPELVPRVFGSDMQLQPMDAPTSPPPPASGALVHPEFVEEVVRPQIVRVRKPSGRPFSNYQKYMAKTEALKGQTIHITSVGPYISKPEQRNLDDQDLRYRSIHKEAFKPAGLWDKFEPPPGGWGFAAAGFILPDDLPNTAKRFGSFYNTHSHQFRATEPKKNLYM